MFSFSFSFVFITSYVYSAVVFSVLSIEILEQLSRFSVDNFKFSHRPVEDGHAIREGWNSIHVDGVDGVLAVQFALKDHLDALEVLILDGSFSFFVGHFTFVKAEVAVLVFACVYEKLVEI